jgi:putative spermidine/putrescine transport system substrate-binding protein
MASQAKAGVIANTMTDGSTSEMLRIVAEGLLEPIDWAAINPAPMYDEARQKYGFGASYCSTIMARRYDAKAPSNFVDFFDTEKFPGTRAPPDFPDYVLPFAALAAGQGRRKWPRGSTSTAPSRCSTGSRRIPSGGSSARSRPNS